jgi:hypothetical protein
MNLKPDETDLVGKWVSDGDRVVSDPVETRITRLIEGQLEKIAIGPESGGWEMLYRDPLDGRYWELTYPHSEWHGGGPRRLTIIDAQAATAKYRLASELGHSQNQIRTKGSELGHQYKNRPKT